ncbi:MAG: protein kinase, partial [Sandaracinaceae bacterium]
TYRLTSTLGRGGMGAVFAADHLRTGRSLAVKVLLPEMALRTDSLVRFRREAMAVSALGHANIVAVHDFAESDGLASLVMDRLEGEDLACRIGRGAMSVEACVPLVRGICAGLHAAHTAGLLHRDLKPANVFLASQPGAEERAVLLDFGLVKSFSDGDVGRDLTLSGVVMGTPAHMSPEQAAGQPLDRRSDLYSLASIVYEMLTERPPLSAPTMPALFAKLLTDTPPPLSAHRPSLAAFDALFVRGLSKRAEDRFPSANAFLAAFEGAASQPPGPATRSVPPPYAVSPPAPRAIVQAGATPMEVTQAAPAAFTPAKTSTGARAVILAVLGLSAFCVIGAFAGLGLYLWADGRPSPLADRTHVASLEPPAAAEVPVPGVPFVEEEAVPDALPADQTDDATDETRAEENEEEAEEAPAPTRRRRRAARRPRTPLAAVSPPSPASPLAGTPPTANRSDPVVRATEYSQRGDYMGCVRELRAARPTTTRILHARFACASSARNQQEIRDVCGEIMQRNPGDPMIPACTALSH